MSRAYEALKRSERERQKKLEERPSSEFVDLPQEDTGVRDEGKASEPSKRLSPDPKAVVAERVRKAAELRKTGSSTSNPFLVTFVEPESVVAEQFRKLKAKIHRLNASKSLKTIMITSAMDGEGKSFTAANLGVSLAREIHNRVLMIDCDLRNPTLTEYFGLENRRGLSDYIQGGGGLQDLVKETRIERLRILPAGMAENAPADLIASNKMKALLNELKSQPETEFVVIDSPPLLATTEPEVLATLVDGVIFVVRAGVTPRETVEQAMASLEKGKILGAVLNDLVFKTAGLRSSYFGMNGYYYKHGYGHGSRETNIEEDKQKKIRFGWRKKGTEQERKRRP
jgi:exopolysaccharide/PEP-CTERM locus tyrosine autokinase